MGGGEGEWPLGYRLVFCFEALIVSERCQHTFFPFPPRLQPQGSLGWGMSYPQQWSMGIHRILIAWETPGNHHGQTFSETDKERGRRWKAHSARGWQASPSLDFCSDFLATYLRTWQWPRGESLLTGLCFYKAIAAVISISQPFLPARLRVSWACSCLDLLIFPSTAFPSLTFKSVKVFSRTVSVHLGLE